MAADHKASTDLEGDLDDASEHGRARELHRRKDVDALREEFLYVHVVRVVQVAAPRAAVAGVARVPRYAAQQLTSANVNSTSHIDSIQFHSILHF